MEGGVTHGKLLRLVAVLGDG